MEHPSFSKNLLRKPSLWITKNKPARTDDIVSKKATKAKDANQNFFKNKKDAGIEKPSSPKNMSRKRLTRGVTEPTKNKSGRAEDVKSKNTIKVQQTKRNLLKTKKQMEALNYDSPTQTRANIRIPIINTKLLNYMVNSQVKRPIKEKKRAKKDDAMSMKNKNRVDKKSVEKSATKSKSKKLKMLDSPNKSEISLRRRRSLIVEKPAKKDVKNNKSKMKISDSLPDKSFSEVHIRRLRRERSLASYPTVPGNEIKTGLLKRKMRSQVWKLAKNTIKANEHWQSLLAENNINIDNINPEAIDHSIINIDALGIKNKFVKRTISWLLK